MTSMEADIRWKQRFASYAKALGQLRAAVAVQTERPLSDLERQGLIKSFEFTHELARHGEDESHTVAPRGLGGLSPATIEKLRSVFTAYRGVERVVLYGSRAKGTHDTGSDIDMMIVGEALDTLDLLRIETAIDDLLLPHMVDIALLHHVTNAELIEYIRRVGVTLYSRAD